MKPRILHLSADYPDKFQPAKTRAISGLIEGTGDQFEHLVVSLNRKGGLAGLLNAGRIMELIRSDRVLGIRYAAPPAVAAINPAMDQLSVALVEELTRSGFKPDLIQGHKLTIEGVLAAHLSFQLGVPYVLTLQGNTDQKLLSLRPDRLPKMRQIWREACGIMAFAPWTANWCTTRLGQPAGSAVIIPCLLPHDTMLPPIMSEQVIRTAFNLDYWRNKNIATLLTAIAQLAPRFPEVRLEIAGSGSAEAKRAIAGLTAKLDLTDRVKLVGSVAPASIQAWLNGAAAFALPSRRESFGMVFAESLLAGTPVIHPRGAAIDGFFPGARFARAVAATDPQRLSAALAEFLLYQDDTKAALAAAQQSGKLDVFRRENVLRTYAGFLQRALFHGSV